MKLRAVRVSDVKGFAAPGKAVEGITDGLNVMAAENEFGKSSLFEALRAALFETYSYKNERTKALRPYQSGGAPMVEVDLEMPSGLFRIRKRFLSRASASVIDVQRGQAVAAADEVQDWIVELLGAAKPDDGPTGLLWVEQGQSLKQPKAGGHAGELLAGLLEREVSTVTGGAKLREVLEEAKWQLAQLLTPNTKKPTGTYKTLLKEQNDLTAEVARLEARLDDVEQMRQDMNSLEHTLAELENPKRQSELQQELQLANDRYQEARHVLIRVEDLKKQAAVTERRLEEQTAALEQLQTAQSRTRHLMEQAKELCGKLSECESALNANTKTRDAALEAEQAQQNVCETARRAYETAQQAARAITAQKEFESAKAKVTTAEAIHQEWAAAAKERDQNPIKSSDVQKIEDLQRAAEVADARIEDGQTTVSVTYEDGTSNRIRIGTQVVEDQEAHIVDGRLELSIESVGQVVIEAGRGEDVSALKAAARNCKTALQSALTDAGMKTVADARRVLEIKTEAMHRAAALERELERLVPEGLAKLKADLDALAVTSTIDLPKDVRSEDEARQHYAAAEQELKARREALRVAEAAFHAADTQFRELKAKSSGIDGQIKDALKSLGGNEAWEQTRVAKNAAVADSQTALQAQKQELAALAHKATEVAGLEAQFGKLQRQATQRASELNSATEKAGQLRGMLHREQAEGFGEDLDERKQNLRRVSKRLEHMSAEVRALQTLIETLETVESDQQDRFFEPVMRELDPLLQTVMPDGALRLGTSYAPHELVRAGVTEKLQQLSGGTQEQIAVLTRLAFARFMARQGKVMPVILDDALVYSDDDRIERMFNALTMAASDIQLIVFTCRQKAFQDLGGTQLQLVDWQPD